MLSTFGADIVLSTPSSMRISLSVVVPSGDDERERAEICAKVTAMAMMQMQGGVG